MKTSSVSRRNFLVGLGAAAAIPVVGTLASSTPAAPATLPKKQARRQPVSGVVLAAQWKQLAETKLATQVPPGLARQIHRRLLANA